MNRTDGHTHISLRKKDDLYPQLQLNTKILIAIEGEYIGF